MDSLDFSEDEIQEQLAVLGYRNIPQHRLREFKRDLDELIQQKKLKILESSGGELNFSNRSQLGTNHITTSPPAYTKETGPQCLPSWSGEGSILNAGTGDHHREVLSSWRLNQELDHQDSYARYTVAPRTLRPSEAPHRLHVLPGPGTHESPVPSDPGSDRLSHPTSQASSPEGGGQRKPSITRKVLRKHKGQFFVCNESVHSEDSEPSGRLLLRPATLSFSAWAAMYKLCPGADEESSGNDRSSLHSSSFWSDGEEEKLEVVERAGREEASAAAPGSVSAPPPADPPPASQWESRGHTGDSSHGSVEEEDGDDEDGSEDEDSVANEIDVEGYEDGSDDDDSGSDEEDGGGDKDVGSDDEDSGADDDDGSVDDDCGGGDDEDNGLDGDEADDGGVSDSVVEDEDDGDKGLAGENRGSPAPSHLTSGYGTYRPDSAGKDTEAGTIAEFDGETLAGDESDEEDLYRFYCGDPSPPPHLQPPRPMPRSPDPSEAQSGMGHLSQPGLEEEELRGEEDRKCPTPARKSSADQREDPPPPQAGVGEWCPWRSEGDEHRSGSALEERWTDRRDQQTEPEQELGAFCSNTEIRFIDSHLEPGCAGALWDSLGPRDPDVSSLEEGLGGLRVATASAHRHGDDSDEETENEDVTGQSDDITSQSDGRSSSGLSLTAFESFVRDMVRMQTERVLKPRPKSFIRPALGHPHTRNLKKMDPLTRYLQYKQEWDMFKVPGEKDRKALRWEIREQLAYQAPPARPRRAYVPNSYIVPTDKKRSALRWEVRNDLANGLLPPKQNYRF